jgi:SAM-dependent methyltransferase
MNKNIDNQSDYWDSVAESKTFTHPIDLPFLAEFVAKDASILDFGCGYGRIMSILAKAEYQNIQGFDTSKALIERGLKAENLPLFHIETPFDLPVADGSVYCVLLFAVLTCIPSNQGQRDLIRLLRSKLKPDGVIYVSDYFLQEDLSEVSRYTFWQGDEANFGVFSLPEGATFRHHPPEWIDSLFEGFHKEKMQEIAVKTMNGHEAKGIQMMWRKIL